MMLGGNRKRPSAPTAKGAGKETHGNAAPWGPLNSMAHAGQMSLTPLHSAYEAEAKGTGSDMSVKNTST